MNASEGLGHQVANLLLQAFGNERNPKLRRAAQLTTVGTVGWQLVKQARARRAAGRDYQITVSETDAVYPLLHGWLLEQMPAEDRRSLAVHTARAGTVAEAETPAPSKLRMLYDGRKTAPIDIAGHRVVASIEQPHQDTSGDDDLKMFLKRSAKLVFTSTSIEGRDAVLAVIAELADQADDRGPRLHMARYDYWYERKDIPERPLDTVILKADQRETIVADLEHFFASEDTYARLGLPWHRGYLFHGPPGTGKSSLAKALASHFRLDVHYASLGDCKSNQSLLTLVGNVPARAMLLLEDVDVLDAATTREEKDGASDLSALLNALDGMATPHGLITVMTTNNLDSIDDALLRPGRVDRIEHIDYLDADQAQRLANLICGRQVTIPETLRADLTPAEVLENVKPHLDNPDTLQVAVYWAMGTQ